MKKNCFYLLIIAILLAWVLGCSSSSSSDSSSSSVSGVASKGPLSGSEITFYKITNEGKPGEKLGSTTTDLSGNYKIDLAYSGPVLVIAKGGKYKDEATGEKVELKTELRAAIADASTTTKASITPLTEIAVQDAINSGGLKPEIIKASNKKIGQLVGDDTTDITSVMPFDPEDEGTAKTEIEKKYTLLLAGISQMLKEVEDLGKLMAEMSEDIKNGQLNNKAKSLNSAVEEYTTNNKSSKDWAKKTKDSLSEAITAAEKGFKPTGSLADAKKALIDFIKVFEKDETDLRLEDIESSLDEFLHFMNTMPDEPEAHLINSIAIILNLYNDPFVDKIKKEFDIFDLNDEGINEKISEFVKTLFTASGKENIESLIKSIEKKLELLKDELNQIKISDDEFFTLSLTGFDTIRFDKTDVLLIHAFVEGGLACVNLLQAHNLEVENWEFELNGEKYDYLTYDDYLIDSDLADKLFFNNNPKLLTFSESKNDELASLETNILNASKLFKEAINRIELPADPSKNSRAQHAFDITNTLEIEMLKQLAGVTLSNLETVLSDSSASFTLVDNKRKKDSQKYKVIGDYAYYTATHELYETEFKPNPFAREKELTIADFFKGKTDLRKLINNETDLYEPGTPELTKDSLEEIDYEWKIPAKELKKASITIDGKIDDWKEISPVFKDFGIEIKMAKSLEPSKLNFLINVYDEKEVSPNFYINIDYYKPFDYNYQYDDPKDLDLHVDGSYDDSKLSIDEKNSFLSDKPYELKSSGKSLEFAININNWNFLEDKMVTNVVMDLWDLEHNLNNYGYAEFKLY